jgi:hypothetical protein
LNNPLQEDGEIISDLCEEECLQKNVRRVRIEFDCHDEFHEFLESLLQEGKYLIQKLKNIEFCDIEWSSEGWDVETGYNKTIVGWFWFVVRNLMRRCPRNVPCSCCMADPEIRFEKEMVLGRFWNLQSLTTRTGSYGKEMIPRRTIVAVSR